MRKQVALKNSIIGLVSNIVTMLLSFACTRVFMRGLGVEIKGINGLLSNCLGLLQLTELGIGNAIIYALYKPLVDNNTKEIQILMQLYSKLYKYIGIAILFAGFILSFFLQVFITDSSYTMQYIRIVFYIQLLSSASTYFIAYKRNLIYADQKMYINTMVDTVCDIVGNILKIISIIVFRSYIIYLILQVIQTVTSNLIINEWCNKNYPYLREKVTDRYDKMPELKKNVRDIMIGKIGGFVYGSTDNIIISKFVGIVEVGYMSSYYQIVNAVSRIVTSITSPIQPMIGNYVNEYDDKEKTYNLFLSYTFIRYCIGNTVAVGMITMMNPLVGIWLGNDYILSELIPILMAVDMFIAIVHGPTGEYIQVLGLFKMDRNLSYGGMVINLVLSILFVKKFGTVGVLMGTVAAQVYYWIVRACIVFRCYFKKGSVKYIINIAGYIVLMLFDIVVLRYIRDRLFVSFSILLFLTMCIICVCISVLSIVICYGKTKEFSTLVQFVGVFLGKIKR